MRPQRVVAGQRVTEEKLRLAREFRRALTPEERLLWQRLRGHRLANLHFRRQQVIDGFIVDFYCHAVGLAVEVDGGVHLGQAGYDAERDQVLARRGIRVLRVRNEEVRDGIEAVLARIAAAAQQDGVASEEP